MRSIRAYTTDELPLQFRIIKKAFQNAIQTYWKISQEAKDDHDKIDAMEHYMDAHQTLWALLFGGEAFENNRQLQNKLEMANQQRQQLIAGGNRET